MALYTNLTAEIMNMQANEGIPYMRVHGLWARIVVDDATEFCQLYGYLHGDIVTTVRAYGGFIWARYPKIQCLVDNESTCINDTELQEQWYDGVYVACRDNARFIGHQGANNRTDTSYKDTMAFGSIQSVFMTTYFIQIDQS